MTQQHDAPTQADEATQSCYACGCDLRFCPTSYCFECGAPRYLGKCLTCGGTGARRVLPTLFWGLIIGVVGLVNYYLFRDFMHPRDKYIRMLWLVPAILSALSIVANLLGLSRTRCTSCKGTGHRFGAPAPSGRSSCGHASCTSAGETKVG